MEEFRSDYVNCISDLFKHENVKSMVNYIQHGDVSCLEHSIRISYRSFVICRFLRLDWASVARGGLLHDYFLYDWHNSPCKWHGFVHPKLALANASRDFDLNNIEKNIIKTHMWPLTIIPPRYLESFIVCLVDKYCSLFETLGFFDKKTNYVDFFVRKLCYIEV